MTVFRSPNAELERLKTDQRRAEFEVEEHSTFPYWLHSDFIHASGVRSCFWFDVACLVVHVTKLFFDRYGVHSLERFDDGSLDNWNSFVYVWVYEARGNRR